MSDIIILAVLALILGLSLLKLKKKGGTSCCSSGGYTLKRRRVEDKNPRHYPISKRLAVEGMTCENCVIRVENALNFQPGAWAKADLKTGSVLLRLKSDIPEEELRALLKDVGYEMTGAETL